MNSALQSFTERQHMVSGDFEYFHYRDEPCPQVHYHNHDFYEIYFFISGKVSYVIEGKTYKLRSGDILLINNSEFHMPVIEKGQLYERIVVWLKPEFLQSKSLSGTNLKLCFEGTAGQRLNLLRIDEERLAIVKGVLLRLGKTYSASGFGSDILREACLLELLVCLNRICLDMGIEQADIEDIVYNEKVTSMINFINENPGGDLTLNELSKRFYISKYHMLRVFKKYTGCTLHHYIRRKRLIVAKDLLGKGHTVSEACIAAGFGDYSNFIRSFRNEFGISPGKYSKIQ